MGLQGGERAGTLKQGVGNLEHPGEELGLHLLSQDNERFRAQRWKQENEPCDC